MDCFKYKIQLSERTTQKVFWKKQNKKKPKRNLQTVQFKLKRAGLWSWFYDIVIIRFPGGTVEAEPLMIPVEQTHDHVRVGTDNLLRNLR